MYGVIAIIPALPISFLQLLQKWLSRKGYAECLFIDNLPAANAIALSAYPNPVAESGITTIRYSLPQSGYTSLKVYNALGMQVADLAEGYMESGTHTATFNTSALPAGIYVYRLTSGGASAERSFLVTQ